VQELILLLSNQIKKIALSEGGKQKRTQHPNWGRGGGQKNYDHR